MKNLRYITTTVLVLFTMAMQAQSNNELDPIIEKGKSDLIEILSKTKENFDFGLDVEEVRISKKGTAIPNYEMDFEKLLVYQQGETELFVETERLTVPLINKEQVVTTIGVFQDKKENYQVAELINQNYQYELNRLPKEIKQGNFKGIKVVEVPNLNTNIYMDDEGKSYTSYKGHSLEEGIPTAQLIEELRQDAIVFQKEYGELLKKNKLVK